MANRRRLAGTLEVRTESVKLPLSQLVGDPPKDRLHKLPTFRVPLFSILDPIRESHPGTGRSFVAGPHRVSLLKIKDLLNH